MGANGATNRPCRLFSAASAAAGLKVTAAAAGGPVAIAVNEFGVEWSLSINEWKDRDR